MSSRRNSLSRIHETLLPEQVRHGKHTHAGLWLDKYIVKQGRKENESRCNLVNEVAAIPVPEAYNTFYKRWEETLAEFGAKTQAATVLGRMVVGLGDESVLETSVTLHHTYGIPYIPGSALKGVAASYVHQKLGEEWNKESKESKAYKTIIFGETDEAGYITFFDAYYVPGSGHQYRGKVQPLYTDIITVHHPKYYQWKGKEGDDKATPADWDSPTPIPFLSATGQYLIALAAPDLEEPLKSQWINITFAILGEALQTMGIGAKTSSGYGRMRLDIPLPPPVDPELQSAHGYKKEIDGMPINKVTNEIHGYYQKWQQLKTTKARTIVAAAIIEKVRQAGREKASAEKAWYKELVAFLDTPGK